MAKVIVTTVFKDKFDNRITYKVGQEVEFADEARVADLVSRGLTEVVGKSKEADTAEAEKVEVVDAPKPKGRPKVELKSE